MNTTVAVVLLVTFLMGTAAATYVGRAKAMHIWLMPYLADRFRKRVHVRRWCENEAANDRPAFVFICIADHFEPKWQNAGPRLQAKRVSRWVKEYPRLCEHIRDSRGRPPQHTFFYAEDHYEAHLVDQLAELCHSGFGDVEIHVHHENETGDKLRTRLENFRDTLHFRHGLLRRDDTGKIAYGFIHGDWALDNSHPRGRHCGVDNELTILRETGCYADFTLPSIPHATQTRTVNSIYYAIDDPLRPKSHDLGIRASVGQHPPNEGLLLIQGPLMLAAKNRKWGVLPRIEHGAIHHACPATLDRFYLWCQANVGVGGQPNWLFIKLHTHGCPESNADVLLGESMRMFHKSLRDWSQRHPQMRYCYVTAWEMAQLVRQAECGFKEPNVAAITATTERAATSNIR